IACVLGFWATPYLLWWMTTTGLLSPRWLELKGVFVWGSMPIVGMLCCFIALKGIVSSNRVLLFIMAIHVIDMLLLIAFIFRGYF
ncbi:MAG: hypothetical protein ACRC2T_12900, partial [Thermoguttaceae bacterium]